MEPIVRGRVWKFGDNMDADSDIIPFEKVRDFLKIDADYLAQFAMTGVDPDFPKKVKPGDILVAGENFGSGHPHIQGILAFQGLNLGAVLCDSVTRGYFRKSMIYGVAMLPVKGITKVANEGDELEVRLREGLIVNLTTGATLEMNKLPDFLLDIIS